MFSLWRLKQSLVGIGFGVFTLLAPVAFLIGLIGSLRTACEWGSWIAVTGIAIAMAGYLSTGGLSMALPALAVQAMMPAVGLTYVHQHGNSWAWVLGWSVFVFGLASCLVSLAKERRPKWFSYDNARRILTGYDEIPRGVMVMRWTARWLIVVGLGVFLVLANMGIRGSFATVLPLATFASMFLIDLILTVRYRRQLMGGVR